MAFWVFGYGSLLWNPGFTPVAQVKARLADYHRSFCMLSIHHRGTEENPGLVLALDKQAGAQCTGVAFQVSDREADRVLEELRARELVSSAYYEETVSLQTDAGEEISALTYIVDPAHRQYCQFSLEQQARMIADATGGQYFRATDNEKLEAIYDEINKLEKTEVEEFKYYKYEEKFRPWILLAGALLLAEWFLRNTLFRSFI